MQDRGEPDSDEEFGFDLPTARPVASPRESEVMKPAHDGRVGTVRPLGTDALSVASSNSAVPRFV